MGIMLILSPAKRMDEVEGPPYVEGRPRFLDRTALLAERLREMSLAECQGLWGCSDRLARLNYERHQAIDLARTGTPAAVSFVGIAYQHLAAGVMSDGELDYLRSHLRILSGLYGVLRPLDGVVPYRLEMGQRLSVDGARDLYGFWGADLLDAMVDESATVIVNVASEEYAKAVTPYAPTRGVPVVTCAFVAPREKDGRLVQRATEAKAARGTFVRWCAENDVEDVGELSAFSERDYAFEETLSSPDLLTFVRGRV
jgi:cytoplasmic iron level regulating protein YaaA (DUF328/UPF0246 family)